MKDNKLTILYERENKGKPVKQCNLTSQVKKTRQKEEKYKITNKMKDVRIMKKIQIYNNLQVLWSSKVKFVSLSQLLGCPLFGSNSGLFSSRFYCLTCGNLKKKKRRKGEEIKRERKKEGIKQERRKEKEGVKRKKVIKKKKYLKRNNKSLLLASNWPSQFCWSSCL